MYWPEDLNRPVLHGHVRVTLQESLILAAYTVCTFSVQMDGNKMERIIRQFHFTIWPDHGVPDEPSPLLRFVRTVMKSNSPNAGPMVVHCSAGVGRTGTFITLHTELQRIEKEGKVDIFNFVRSMRQRRCFMVQTEVWTKLGGSWFRVSGRVVGTEGRSWGEGEQHLGAN